jgi:aspartate racemase
MQEEWELACRQFGDLFSLQEKMAGQLPRSLGPEQALKADAIISSTMMREAVPRRFGLISGLGMGAGIFYYTSLVKAHLALGLSPSILMVHADVRRVMGHAAARQSRELATYLTGLLRQLANGGAQIGTIPAFSPQICAQELAEMSPLTLIDLLDVIVTEVERRRLQRVAIFGARVTVETKLFGRLQNVDVVTPSPQEVDLLSNIYVRIVEGERASEQECANLRDLAHTLIDRERLDAILLAGTDLSFVFDPENTDFPHLDGARTRINAIMDKLAPPGMYPARGVTDNREP